MAADAMKWAQAICLALSLSLAGGATAKESDGIETDPADAGGGEAINPVPKVAEPVAVKPAPPALAGNPLWAIPLRTLSTTRDRPLFSPSRRPPTPIVPAAPDPAPPMPTAIRPPPPEQPPWILVGTIVGEKEKFAFLFNINTKAVIRLREGDEEIGWRLKEVEFRSTVLEKGERSVTLELPKPGEPQSTNPSSNGDAL